MYINTDNYSTHSEILEAIGIPYKRRIESWDPQEIMEKTEGNTQLIHLESR